MRVGHVHVKAKHKSLWIASSLSIGREQKAARNYICSPAKSLELDFI